MFTNIYIKLFRFFLIIISVVLLVVMMMDTDAVLAQTPLLGRVGISEDNPVLTTGNSPNYSTPLDPAKISFQEIASGLTKPVFITHAGDGSGRIFVIEQTGYIRILKNGTLLGIPFLDIHASIKSGSEQGLLGLAFHPSYSTNGIFFVVYTAPKNGSTSDTYLILKRFSVSANNPDLADPASGVILLSISHPAYSNHNGGTLAFGGDGYLYWSTGDGGGGGDPYNNAQQLNNLLGKILRIDVNSGSPYGIPTGNPFYSSNDPNVKKEIWAYGLRNPWRLSFDRLTHDLYVGDVGQAVREEVDFQPAGSTGGENYGWRVMEGGICYNPSSGCNQSGKILPVAEYNHTLGCSITGGYVYRGLNFPSLTGYYFYGDFCSGRLFSLYNDSVLGWNSVQLVDTPYSISTFGEDGQGEIYLADYGTGKLYNLQYQEAPFVTSSVLANGNPTALENVDFTVTFSEAVTGVDVEDFTLATTGDVSGAIVSGINGSESVYIVTVNTGNGNGTIRLDVVDNDTIMDTTFKPLWAGYASGQMYDIDKFSPTVASSLRANTNPTSAASVNFTVTFSEPVTGVDTVGPPFDDFALTTSPGISGASITSASGSGSIYTVTVNTGNNDGTIRLDVPNTATIADLAGNLLASLPYASGDTYTINKPPVAAALIFPIGPIETDYNPIYTWNKVDTATWYHLYISGPKGKLLDQWYETSSICGDTTCSVAPGPTFTLGGGNHSWYVQAYNAVGNGPWSAKTDFSTTILGLPSAPVLSHPTPDQDLGANYTPTFQWNKVDGVTWYHLYVGGPKGKVLDKWYSSVTICPAAACSVVSPLLGGGNHTWSVQTYNPAGYSSWVTQKFSTSTTPPAAPGLIYPTADENIGAKYTPTYLWKKVPEATYYRLIVKLSSSVVLDKWYTQESICDIADDGECSVLSPQLKVGTHTWSVQTYSPAGTGGVSSQNFTTIADLPDTPGLIYPTAGQDLGASYTPTFTWNRDATVTWYHLYVGGPKGKILDQWYTSISICDKTTIGECSILSPTLGAGNHSWSVQGWNPSEYGLWSTQTFITSTALPAKIVLSGPIGSIVNYTPKYIWNKVPEATYYHLWVNGPGNVKMLDKWYLATSVSCDIVEAGKCELVSPTTKMGTHTWWMQAYNPAGNGDWSDPMIFTTPTDAVPAPVLTYPKESPPGVAGNIGMDYNPRYAWEKVESATHYHIYVKGPKGKVLDKWYEALSICDAVGCAVPQTMSPTLNGGAHSWWAQAYSPKGNGLWTAEMKFFADVQTVPPGAVLVSPKGTTSEHMQTYAWTKVPIATWYRVYVKGPGGVILDKWYQSVNVCIGDACSVTGPRLESGDHIWWVQTYNSAGDGPWKSATFKVSP